MSYNTNICVFSSGNGTSLKKVFENNSEVIKIIITNNHNANIIKKAQTYKIPYFCILINKDNYHDSYNKVVNLLRLYNINLILLVGYMNIIPKIIFDEFITLNIHPSLLPKYSCLMDLKVHESVINNNDKYSGCTLHKVNEIIDGGEIVIQKKYKLELNETPNSLKEKIQELEIDCIYEFVNIFIDSKKKCKINYSVNIEEANEFVNEIKKDNNSIGGFFASYDYKLSEYEISNKFVKLASCTDGCGTKLDLANKYNKLEQIGIDCVAMNVNDLYVGGAKPLFFMDYISIDTINKEKCMKIICGINEGCKIANCKLIGGETSESKGIYLKDKLDLAGFCVGEIIYDFPKLNKINTNCYLYGIESSGIHSNGYTLVKELLNNNYEDTPNIDDILTPTRIYYELIDIFEEYNQNIFGAAHITGGGYHDNLIRILPENLYFQLFDWNFPDIFKWIQQKSKLNKQEMLNTFNCGYGIVIVSNTLLPYKCIGKVINKE